MQPININVSLNSHNLSVNVSELPDLSINTHLIFSEHGHQPSNSDMLVKAKVWNLKDVLNCMDQAKKNSKRDKILAVFATAVSVALLAASILAFTMVLPLSPFLAPQIGIASAALYVFITGIVNKIYMDRYSPALASYQKYSDLAILTPFCPIGPFMPIIHAFRKVNRLNETASELKNDIKTELESRVIRHQVEFYRDNHKDLSTKINQQLAGSIASLAQMKNLAVKSPAGEKELQQKIDDLKVAQKDLKKANDFYMQYSAAVP